MRSRVRGIGLCGIFLFSFLLGCIGTSQDEGAPSTTTPSTSVTTPPPRVTGFLIEDLRIGHAESDRPLREDDVAVITYSLRNAATGGTNASFLVSYAQDGEVMDVQTVRLEPGGSATFRHSVDDLRDLRPIKVEVRAGDQHASAEAHVLAWPRAGQREDLGALALTVNRWLKNTADGGTDVNVTVERKPAPEGNYSMLRARLLCADDAGQVTTRGEQRPNAPEPESIALSDIHLPGCETTLYGVEFSAKGPQDESLYVRFLFVDRAWRPANG